MARGRGKPISIRKDPLQQLETEVAGSRAWRCSAPGYEFNSNKKLEKKRMLTEEQLVRHPIFQGLSDPREIVKAFKQAEQVPHS